MPSSLACFCLIPLVRFGFFYFSIWFTDSLCDSGASSHPGHTTAAAILLGFVFSPAPLLSFLTLANPVTDLKAPQWATWGIHENFWKIAYIFLWLAVKTVCILFCLLLQNVGASPLVGKVWLGAKLINVTSPGNARHPMGASILSELWGNAETRRYLRFQCVTQHLPSAKQNEERKMLPERPHVDSQAGDARGGCCLYWNQKTFIFVFCFGFFFPTPGGDCC